jgi:hypothetical protein
MTDLKPGRELDALVAEKVMGFTVVFRPARTVIYRVRNGGRMT